MHDASTIPRLCPRRKATGSGRRRSNFAASHSRFGGHVFLAMDHHRRGGTMFPRSVDSARPAKLRDRGSSLAALQHHRRGARRFQDPSTVPERQMRGMWDASFVCSVLWADFRHAWSLPTARVTLPRSLDCARAANVLDLGFIVHLSGGIVSKTPSPAAWCAAAFGALAGPRVWRPLARAAPDWCAVRGRTGRCLRFLPPRTRQNRPPRELPRAVATASALSATAPRLQVSRPRLL